MSDKSKLVLVTCEKSTLKSVEEKLKEYNEYEKVILCNVESNSDKEQLGEMIRIYWKLFIMDKDALHEFEKRINFQNIMRLSY